MSMTIHVIHQGLMHSLPFVRQIDENLLVAERSFPQLKLFQKTHKDEGVVVTVQVPETIAGIWVYRGKMILEGMIFERQSPVKIEIKDGAVYKPVSREV